MAVRIISGIKLVSYFFLFGGFYGFDGGNSRRDLLSFMKSPEPSLTTTFVCRRVNTAQCAELSRQFTPLINFQSLMAELRTLEYGNSFSLRFRIYNVLEFPETMSYPSFSS
jgi:hypothetical protein